MYGGIIFKENLFIFNVLGSHSNWSHMLADWAIALSFVKINKKLSKKKWKKAAVSRRVWQRLAPGLGVGGGAYKSTEIKSSAHNHI